MKKISMIIKSLRKYLLLDDWTLKFAIVEDTEELGQMEKADYSRFLAALHFQKKYVEESSNDDVIELVMHELCHIITIAPLQVFNDDEYNHKQIWHLEFISIHSKMNIYNEQMNIKLTKIMMRGYKKTKAYKKLILKLEKKYV